MYQRPNFKAVFWGVFVQVEMETEFFFQKIIDCNYSKKEEKVGHNTLGWISIELLIRSILRIFFSFFNNVTEIVEGVYF